MQRVFGSGLLVAVAVVLAGPASAQTEITARGGLSIGAVMSDLTGDDISSADPRWGLTVGAYGGFVFGKYVGMTIEANWNQGGAKKIDGVEGDNLTTSAVQFPLLLALMIPLDEEFVIRIYGGGAANLNLSCNKESGGLKISCDGASGVEEESLVWSAPVGAGFAYDLPGSPAMIVIDARYDMGLTDLFRDSAVKGNSWQFKVRGEYPFN